MRLIRLHPLYLFQNLIKKRTWIQKSLDTTYIYIYIHKIKKEIKCLYLK